MGINDRDYYRGDQPGFHLGGNHSMTVTLVLVTIGCFILQYVIDSGGPGIISNIFHLDADFYRQPWKIYQLLTYGFLHATDDWKHVAFNMFGLWMFGTAVEQRYGRKQFLWLYLTAIIFSGLVWAVVTSLAEGKSGPLVGASGGVVAVIILFCICFPKRTILLMFVFPVPAWVVGVLVILGNLSGTFSPQPDGPKVAFIAHLGGALYGLLYYSTQWSLLKLLPANFSLPTFKPRSRLKIHDPDQAEEKMSAEVDAILEKIKEQGQDSLTAKERKTLERASRRYQQKHR